jgi:hypothetical protein
MKKPLCAHCKNCKEVKYDGFLCDCTGYIADKNVEEGCDHFEDDGFDLAKKPLDQAIEDEVKTMYRKKPYEDYDKLVKFRNDVIDAIGISNAGYTDDWLDKFVDSQAAAIIRKAVNESSKNTSKHHMADLIATMTINGATKEELDRAIKYSAAVIDAERSRKDLGIDELVEKYIKVDSHGDCPESKTYEGELDAVDAFFDKYDALIKSAPRNSLLGMINELNDAFLYIEGVIGDRDEQLLPSNEDVLNQSKKHITHVALILAQMWSDENRDIELICTDPETGEETVINGKEEKENESC